MQARLAVVEDMLLSLQTPVEPPPVDPGDPGIDPVPVKPREPTEPPMPPTIEPTRLVSVVETGGVAEGVKNFVLRASIPITDEDSPYPFAQVAPRGTTKWSQAQVSYLSYKIRDDGVSVPDVAMVSALVPPTDNQQYAIVGAMQPLPDSPSSEIDYANVTPEATLTLVSRRQTFLGEIKDWEVLESGPAITVWKGQTIFKNNKIRTDITGATLYVYEYHDYRRSKEITVVISNGSIDSLSNFKGKVICRNDTFDLNIIDSIKPRAELERRFYFGSSLYQESRHIGKVVESLPVRRPRPVPVLGAEYHAEESHGLIVETWWNRRRESVPVLNRTLAPRASMARFQGSIIQWANAEAERLGWRGLLPAHLDATLGQHLSQDLAAWARDTWFRTFATERGDGGGGWMVQRNAVDWQRSANGLAKSLSNFLGWINRCEIVADWSSLAEPKAYSLHRAPGAQLDGYAPQSAINTPDGAHLSRLYLDAVFLATHTTLQLPRVWLAEVWADTSRSLGVGVPEGSWYFEGPEPAVGHTAPLWSRIEATHRGVIHGWLGRDRMHVYRLAHMLHSLGIMHPNAPVTPAEAIDLMDEAILAHIKASPWRDERRGIMQYANAAVGQNGGYAVDNLPASDKALGRWALAGESYYWAAEPLPLGVADYIRRFLGPHSRWAVLLDYENAPLNPGMDRRYGGNSDWYNPYVPSGNAVPNMWRTCFPDLLQPFELAEIGKHWASNREHVWDFVAWDDLVRLGAVGR